MTTRPRALLCVLGLSLLSGCSDSTGAGKEGGSSSSNLEPKSTSISIGPDARSFVELAGPSQLDIQGRGDDSIAWDLALQGQDVFSNGGVSGPGNCKVFGPLSAPTFLSDSAPEVPLMLEDRAGGALLDWYDYVGTTHQLFSRYHVYGLKDGDRLFKLQVLGYYGEKLGAPVSALYHVRYAEVSPDGVGPTQELADIDATAGGSQVNDSEPSGCVNLDSGEVTELTPKQAAADDTWQLCFRREGIAVNGGLAGPRGVQAVDLQADATADETEADIQKRSADSELERFDSVDYAALSDEKLAYREDGVVTAFAQRWLEPGSDPPALSDSVWLVVPASGVGNYFMHFLDLKGDPTRETATLTVESKKLAH
jgi:hypothetical protein